MSNLFISHSSRDNAAATELQARLEEQGHHSVFLDLDPETGIQAGVSWERTLYTKLRACRAVVALCSNSYLASQWCFAEIALARMEGKEVFVLQIDPWSEQTQMPSILTEEQYIDLRTNKDDGYQRLWNGFKVKGIVAAEAREWKPQEPPYPGLRAFREEDAPIFFGRDEEIREGGELLNRVRRQGHPRLVMVLGSSGSGKSSLVRAGIVPQLRRDRGQWLVVKPFRPGRQPARELAASLSQAFDEAGQAFPWEEIHRWLEPATGDPAAPAPEQPATVEEAEPSPATARKRLLQALSAMEGELTAADDQVASSVRRLKDYLGQQQTETPLPSGGPPPPSVASPLAELTSRLRLQSRLTEATLVLVIDQFEELLGHDAEHPASRFLTMLRTAMEVEDSPLLVIGTMRSDYLGVLQRSAPLQGFGFKSLSVGPMSRDGMRQIIEEPAKLGQIQLENGLADLLLEDTETSDALPLLAFTLRMMWDRYHDKRLLEIREYKDFGRLQGAIAQVADETFEGTLEQVHDKDSRDALARELRDAFLSMARPAAEGSGWSRQPVSWDQLGEKVQPALIPFIDPQRLLVKRQDASVEVAHEALFRSWDRLKGWLDENAEGLHLRREIRVEAEKWDEASSDQEKEPYLWRGGRLARALELKQGGVLALKDLDESFVEASDRAERARIEDEEARRKRELRWARIIAAVVSVAFVIAVGFGYLAVLAKRDAEEKAIRARDALRISTVLRLEAERSASTVDTRVGLLREIEARDPTTVRGWAALTTRTLALPVSDAILRGPVKQILAIAPSVGGDRVLTVAVDGSVRSWVADGFEEPELLRPATAALLRLVVFSADRTRLLIASEEGASVLHTNGLSESVVLRGSHAEINGAALSPDGTLLLAAFADGTAWLQASNGVGDPVVFRDGGVITAVAFDPQGRRFATASDDGITRVWNADGSGQPIVLGGHHQKVAAVAFSPGGERVVTASYDGTARVSNTDGSGQPIVLRGHKGYVYAAAFSADGRHVITASGDKSALLWNIEKPAEPLVLGVHARSLYAAAFSPDGTLVATASVDGIVQVRRVDGSGTPKILEGTASKGGKPIQSVATPVFLPDSRRIVTAYDDGTTRVWKLDGSGEPTVLRDPGATESVLALAFVPNGERLKVVHADGSIREWKADGSNPPTMLRSAVGWVVAAAFSVDARRLVIAEEGKRAALESLDGTATVDLPASIAAKPASCVAFSRDGERILIGYGDGAARVWNARGSDPPHELLPSHDKAVSAAAFSPDGRSVVTTSYDQTAFLRLLDSPGSAKRLAGPEAFALSAAFRPDGTRVVVGYAGSARMSGVVGRSENRDLPGPQKEFAVSVGFSGDGEQLLVGYEGGMTQVWSADRAGEPIVFRSSGRISAAAFSPDSSHVAVGSEDGTAQVWDLRLRQLLWQRTGACITIAQRLELFGEDKELARAGYERCRRMAKCGHLGGSAEYASCF